MMMKKEKRRVPELRFAGFEGEWEEKRLGKLFSEFKSGNNITAFQIKETGKYPVYGGNGLRGYFDEYTHDGNYFLIGRQGALCGNINRSNGKAYFSEHAIACKANELNDTGWLSHRLEYFDLNRLSESSAQPGLSVGKLLRFKLTVPTLSEQQKIALFLTSIDTQIQQLEKKKTLLELYKKGVMQKIFSQEIRFTPVGGKEFPKWEKKRLNQVSDIVKGKQLNKEALTETGVYACQNGGINPSGYTDMFNTVENTITISEGGNSCGFINLMTSKFWCGGHCYSLLNLKKVITIEYLFQYMKFSQNKIMRLRVGSGLPNIQRGDIIYFTIKVPHISEQTKIAHFLSALDTKISVTSQQIERTKVYKKGLLQKMFV